VFGRNHAGTSRWGPLFFRRGRRAKGVVPGTSRCTERKSENFRAPWLADEKGKRTAAILFFVCGGLSNTGFSTLAAACFPATNFLLLSSGEFLQPPQPEFG